MSHDVTLGQEITGPAERDAVHIAICPVTVVSDYFSPGDRVRFIPGSTDRVRCIRDGEEAVGIIDPFLSRDYEDRPMGKKVWMMLLPNTITSLRHDWTHPAFGTALPVPKTIQEEARRWMETYADEASMTVDELLESADRYQNTGNDTCLNFDTPGVLHNKIQQFWHHYQILTGKKLTRDQESFFRCAC